MALYFGNVEVHHEWDFTQNRYRENLSFESFKWNSFAAILLLSILVLLSKFLCCRFSAFVSNYNYVAVMIVIVVIHISYILGTPSHAAMLRPLRPKASCYDI